jgi:hypothetical protein
MKLINLLLESKHKPETFESFADTLVKLELRKLLTMLKKKVDFRCSHGTILKLSFHITNKLLPVNLIWMQRKRNMTLHIKKYPFQ